MRKDFLFLFKEREVQVKDIALYSRLGLESWRKKRNRMSFSYIRSLILKIFLSLRGFSSPPPLFFPPSFMMLSGLPFFSLLSSHQDRCDLWGVVRKRRKKRKEEEEKERGEGKNLKGYEKEESWGCIA